MFTTCRVQEDQLFLEYKVEEGKMGKSYGIEVMKMLKFPPHVVAVAEKYLQYYEAAQEEEEMGQYPPEVIDQACRLMDEMEEALSKTANHLHDQIRADYQMKIKAVIA